MFNKKNITKFITFSTITLATIHLLNKVIFFTSTVKDLLFCRNGNYYEWRFGKVHYTVQGKGSPILLIHDLTCISSDYEWSSIIDQLSMTNTVYTIDLLGCGRSDKPRITYTNYLFVQLISDFIKNVIKHKTNIIATGSSCTSVLMACFQDKEIIGKILLINPNSIQSISKYTHKNNKIAKHIIESNIIGTLLYNIIISKNNIKTTFHNTYFYDNTKINTKYIDIYHESAHLGESSAKFLFASVANYYTNQNINHALKTINNSIYIIGGEFEPNVQDSINSYVTQNPSIEYSFIHDTKHLPQLENPSDIIEICEMFFC